MWLRHRLLIISLCGILLPISPAWGQTRRGIVAWFECEECDRSDAAEYLKELPFDYVMQSSLAALDGPSLSSRMRYEAVLKRKFDLLTEYAETNRDSAFIGGVPSWESFRNRHIDQYVRSYTLKAAWAVIALASTQLPPDFAKRDIRNQVVEKLTQRFQDSQRSYLKDAIFEALQSLGASPP